MKPLCSLCGSRHEAYQAHVFTKLSKPVNTAVNTNAAAVNTDRHAPGYMRVYMATRRAVKSGRACSWPPGSVSV